MLALVALTATALACREITPEPMPTVVRSLRLDRDGDVWVVETEVYPDGERNEADSRLLGYVTEIGEPEGLEMEFQGLLREWNEGLEFGRSCRGTAEQHYNSTRGV